MANSKQGIVFRVDGGRSVGVGHIVRCHWLASAVRDNYGGPVSFYMNQDDVGIAIVQSRGWPVLQVAKEQLGGSNDDPFITVIDLPGGVSSDAIRSLRERNPRGLVVLMDGTCTGRIEADLVVSPIERFQEPSAWQGFRGERYEGPAYAILDPAFARVPRRLPRTVSNPRILVCMGGSDPYGLTLQALRALDNMDEEFHVTVAVGPAFLHEAELQTWSAAARIQHECRRKDSLLDLMVNSESGVGFLWNDEFMNSRRPVCQPSSFHHGRPRAIGGGVRTRWSLTHLGLYSNISESLKFRTRFAGRRLSEAPPDDGAARTSNGRRKGRGESG